MEKYIYADQNVFTRLSEIRPNPASLDRAFRRKSAVLLVSHMHVRELVRAAKPSISPTTRTELAGAARFAGTLDQALAVLPLGEMLAEEVASVLEERDPRPFRPTNSFVSEGLEKVALGIMDALIAPIDDQGRTLEIGAHSERKRINLAQARPTEVTFHGYWACYEEEFAKDAKMLLQAELGKKISDELARRVFGDWRGKTLRRRLQTEAYRFYRPHKAGAGDKSLESDLAHLYSAAHADIFVTNDEDFRTDLITDWKGWVEVKNPEDFRKWLDS